MTTFSLKEMDHVQQNDKISTTLYIKNGTSWYDFDTRLGYQYL